MTEVMTITDEEMQALTERGTELFSHASGHHTQSEKDPALVLQGGVSGGM
jgi:hypothetical protein